MESNVEYFITEMHIKKVVLSEESIQRHLDIYVKEQIIKAGYTMKTTLDSLPSGTRLLIEEKRAGMEKYLRKEYLEKAEAEDDIPDLVLADGSPIKDFVSRVVIDSTSSESEKSDYFKLRLTSGATTPWCFDDASRCGGRLFFPSINDDDKPEPL